MENNRAKEKCLISQTALLLMNTIEKQASNELIVLNRIICKLSFKTQ